MKKKGFLLFEVLVAILIASTSLVVILQGLGSAFRAGSLGENYFKAKLLAEARLAMLEKEVACAKGTDSGRFSRTEDPQGIFTWQQEIKPVIIGKMADSVLPVCSAKVVVKWRSRGGQRQLTLITYVPRKDETALVTR